MRPCSLFRIHERKLGSLTFAIAFLTSDKQIIPRVDQPIIALLFFLARHILADGLFRPIVLYVARRRRTKFSLTIAAFIELRTEKSAFNLLCPVNTSKRIELARKRVVRRIIVSFAVFGCALHTLSRQNAWCYIR